MNGRSVRRPAVVALNAVNPFATRKTKALWTSQTVGRTPTAIDQTRRCACAMWIHAPHTGGSVRGNCARSPVASMVSYFKANTNSVQESSVV